MKLSQLINRKNTAKKLADIVAIVAKARKKYNNEEATIDAPSVTTTGGCQSIKYLDSADKAAVASKELRAILCEVQRIDEHVQGCNVNRVLTELIAVNPTLVNLEESFEISLA